MKTTAIFTLLLKMVLNVYVILANVFLSQKLGSILAYVRKNKSRIKKEYSVYANYFYYAENEYIVKCGIIEDDAPLIELNLTVASKDQAKLIRKNWKSNVSNIYNTILQSLITNNSPTSNDDEDEDIQEKIENCMQNNDILEEDTNLIPMV